jgi:hypothetical protein
MKKLILVMGLVLIAAAELALAGPAGASFIVGRNPQHPTLQVDSAGRALISFSVAGKPQHVLVWGAVNALPPTRGRTQVAFKVDFSGGYALHMSNYYKTIKNVCKPYTGPPLAWYVPGSGCTAPDGSFWALQLWQRMLPDLGFKPWKPEQAVYELHVSHWTGPLAAIQVWQDWAWGGRYHQILGQLTYGGKPVYGFGSSSVGDPTDTWGRNLYLDTFDSPYGSGWSRENSFLGQQPSGGFCYSFGPRPPYPGYPDSPPRAGPGSKYRITVLGPGVTPAVMWEGPDVGSWNPTDPADMALEAKVAAVKPTLGLTSHECHS